MAAVWKIINFIGGLSVFFYGMRLMSLGLRKRAGGRLRKVLKSFSDTPLKGVFSGTFVTSVVQSSSATTVLVVSLVNAGLLALEEAIGIVFGANIGTTFTAWIVSFFGFKFSLSSLVLPVFALALPLMFNRSEKVREVAEALFGFSLVFLGLSIIKDQVPDVQVTEQSATFFRFFHHESFLSVLAFVLLGTLATMILQSSSTTVAITLTLLYKGWISFPLACAAVLGENIGTTVTALLASIPMNRQAKRIAYAHTLFNVTGVLWMLAVFPWFVKLVDIVVPGPVSDAGLVTYHLSAFHTMFNIINTFLFIWFVKPYAALLRRILPEEAAKEELVLVASPFPESLESNLVLIEKALSRMAERVFDMALVILHSLGGDDADLDRMAEQAREMELRFDEMEEAIHVTLTRCATESMAEEQAKRLMAYQLISRALESMSDSLYRVARLLKQRGDLDIPFHKRGMEELQDYLQIILDFLRYNVSYLSGELAAYDVEHAYRLEQRIDGMRDSLRKRARKKLTKGADVRGELLFMDVVRHLEHVGDYSLDVSQAIKEMAG
ncbi:Na/Pi cotransporter family protein [Spirochaeta thermophila]|uniref:Transporter n=1 Tax=Winmispira thermophila (strain ATCC 49972 / DSM 6192 / RI 19.B1) TaxID=665571 RepID=E0RQQ2_WINT6|nr:Na/Pi cotransporter family protein [Spirochaeta thermophila]ADN01556.1 transporter [Spirochaeta thermophila DSM 6192]